MTKIYTRTGDKGQTSNVSGKRIYKNSEEIEFYGSVDELNSFLGLSKNYVSNFSVFKDIEYIQKTLFKVPLFKVSNDDIIFLENKIDEYEGKLDALDKFIIPGSSKESGFLHVSRSVCRRAERRLVNYLNNKSSKVIEDSEQNTLKYLNRLSDYIFILARVVEELD